ncbi:hypothetical protein JCM21900_000784 [Sporobolomyces salmonicolor]
MPRRQPLPQTDSDSDLSLAPTSMRSRQRAGRGDDRAQRPNIFDLGQAKWPLYGAHQQPQLDDPEGSDATFSDSGGDSERQENSDGLGDEEKGVDSGTKGSGSVTKTANNPPIVDGTWTTYFVSFVLLVFCLAVGIVCYELYLHVSDKWYTWSLVWFATSSPISWMDIVESALNFVVIVLAWTREEDHLLILGLVTAACTFWKTTLYFSVDVCSGFQTTKQDTRFQYCCVLVIYVFPNIFWVALPGAIVVQYANTLWYSLGAPAAPKPAGSTFSFGAPAASSAPSLFGSTTASAPAAAPSLFGSTPAAQPTAGTSLFGNTATSAPAPSGGLFGSSQPAAGSTGLFGAPKPATTSLFGASQPSSTPSLFGTTTSQPAAAPSLFGQSQPAGQTTSLFGQPTQQQQHQQQQQPSLFGQSQPAQPAVTSAPLFGQSQTAASNSLFGSKPASTSLFGSTAPVSAPPAPAAPVPKLGEPYPPPSPNEAPIESRIEAIKAAWDPQNPKCRFQTYFYNEPTPPNTVQMYGRPPNGTDEKAWQKAVRENPDPDHLVPAIAVGFPALQKRIEHQQRQSASHQALLTEVHTHLDSLASTHSLTTSLRTLRAQQNATALASRLLTLVAKASALSPSRNSSVKREEEELRIALEGIKGEVERVRGRANEMWAGVGALKARKMEGEATEWAVADEEGLKKILEILTSQQIGLDHLTRTLSQMTADVDVMNEAFGLPAKGGSSVARR